MDTTMNHGSQVIAHGHAPDPNLPLEYSTEDGSLRILGFWIFLAAEVVLFSCLFATYVVMHPMTAGGPTSKELYAVPGFLWETLFLLTSSFTCGIAVFQMRRGSKKGVIGWMIVTILLGMAFVGFEVQEFVTDAMQGATMQRSGFLSSFFTLVGTHGCHVTVGIFWMISIVIQIAVRGIDTKTSRKIFIVGLYWHFLDVVWIFIFTVVYLTGKVL